MFGDSMKQGDKVAVVLNCGFCNKPAEPGHSCEEKKKWEEENQKEPKPET